MPNRCGLGSPVDRAVLIGAGNGPRLSSLGIVATGTRHPIGMRNLFEKQAFTLALRLAPEQKCRLRLLQDSRNKNGRSAEQQGHHPQHQQDPCRRLRYRGQSRATELATVPKCSCQSSRSDWFGGLDISPRCHIRKSAPSTSPSLSKSPGIPAVSARP